jgi:hypothetical protein
MYIVVINLLNGPRHQMYMYVLDIWCLEPLNKLSIIDVDLVYRTTEQVNTTMYIW